MRYPCISLDYNSLKRGRKRRRGRERGDGGQKKTRKGKKITGKERKKMEPLFIAGGNVNRFSYFGNHVSVSLKS